MTTWNRHEIKAYVAVSAAWDADQAALRGEDWNTAFESSLPRDMLVEWRAGGGLQGPAPTQDPGDETNA